MGDPGTPVLFKGLFSLLPSHPEASTGSRGWSLRTRAPHPSPHEGAVGPGQDQPCPHTPESVRSVTWALPLISVQISRVSSKTDGQQSIMHHSFIRQTFEASPGQVPCKELAGSQVDGHMGETRLLIHLFFHNTSGVFKLHTPLGAGDMVKTERVPKLTEYTSREIEANQTEIPMSLHVVVSARKEQREGCGHKLWSHYLGENLPGHTKHVFPA